MVKLCFVDFCSTNDTSKEKHPFTPLKSPPVKRDAVHSTLYGRQRATRRLGKHLGNPRVRYALASPMHVDVVAGDAGELRIAERNLYFLAPLGQTETDK